LDGRAIGVDDSGTETPTASFKGLHACLSESLNAGGRPLAMLDPKGHRRVAIHWRPKGTPCRCSRLARPGAIHRAA